MKLPALLVLLAMNLTAAEIRIGLIGCDTSHATAFTQILNDPASKNHITGARVVAAVRAASPDIESSTDRLAKEAGVPVWTGSAYRWYISMRELMATGLGVPHLCGETVQPHK